MSLSLENRICRALATILAGLPDGANIPPSADFQSFLDGLEYYLPAVLAEVHGEWAKESLDGILPLVARKTAERELEFVGHCIFISDQTLAPFHLRLCIDPGDANEISWLELSVGERGADGMVRQPYNSGATSKRTYAVQQRLAKIDWAYQVTFGHRVK